MFHLLLTITLILIVFWLFWVPVGGRELFGALFRDELADREAKLASVEEQLASLPTPSPQEPESTTYLRESWEGQARMLRLKISHIRGTEAAEEANQ